MFYFAVAYDHDIPAFEEEILRQWHTADPVDDHERARHEAVEEVAAERQSLGDSTRHERIGRIEMHLVARRDISCRIGDLPLELRAGESLHTVNSYKYAPEEFTRLAADAGFARLHEWTDAEGLFSVFALEAR
jgi:hypothetical protein